jgi:acid phosphatase type 7
MLGCRFAEGLVRRKGEFELALVAVSLLVGALLWGGSAKRLAAQQTGTASKGGKVDGVEQTTVLVGAGDIVGCRDPQGALATAKLIEKIPGTVFAVGDLVYDAATLSQFQKCYGAAWGEFKERTRPALGNHEYKDPHASPYFQYWGAQAGPVGKGYYSYELGAWHVVVLNTNCGEAGVGGLRGGFAAGNLAAAGPARASGRVHRCVWASCVV